MEKAPAKRSLKLMEKTYTLGRELGGGNRMHKGRRKERTKKGHKTNHEPFVGLWKADMRLLRRSSGSRRKKKGKTVPQGTKQGHVLSWTETKEKERNRRLHQNI